MDTLHDRLAELAKDAPTRGAPATELWARGKRTHRIRAAALAATLLVVGAAGTGIGLRLTDVDGNRSYPSPAGSDAIALPIEYPVGKDLPNLGDTPGPLAAVWLSPPAGGDAPQAVGLVADTGTFGTLPIDLPNDDPQAPENVAVALSADGRRLAYPSPMRKMIVHDLVTGENYSPLPEVRAFGVGTWTDATHLVGNVRGGTDAEGWVWEPGTERKLVNYWTYAKEFDLWVSQQGSGPRQCSWAPILLDGTGEYGQYQPGWGYTLEVPVLCDVLGVIDSQILIGHWKVDPGDGNDPNDANGTVVALDIRGAGSSFEDPALRRVVATAGAPQRVAFATDLIAEALDAEGGSS